MHISPPDDQCQGLFPESAPQPKHPLSEEIKEVLEQEHAYAVSVLESDPVLMRFFTSSLSSLSKRRHTGPALSYETLGKMYGELIAKQELAIHEARIKEAKSAAEVNRLEEAHAYCNKKIEDGVAVQDRLLVSLSQAENQREELRRELQAVREENMDMKKRYEAVSQAYSDLQTESLGYQSCNEDKDKRIQELESARKTILSELIRVQQEVMEKEVEHANQIRQVQSKIPQLYNRKGEPSMKLELNSTHTQTISQSTSRLEKPHQEELINQLQADYKELQKDRNNIRTTLEELVETHKKEVEARRAAEDAWSLSTTLGDNWRKGYESLAVLCNELHAQNDELISKKRKV